MKKLHLICNSHIDPIWQWEWEEGASATLSTFQSAINLMEKHDYVFCHNEMNLYEYTERFAPALFSKISEKIQQGKWQIMGGWYLQPDCLMPEGEAFIRQIQMGKTYFQEKFGVFPTTAINLDSFGHSRGIVQIIKKCGQDSYLFMRPWGGYITEQLSLPAETFLWEGYDGSQIKAARITDYNSPMGETREKIENDIAFQSDVTVGLSCWGVGNHGGGPSDKDLRDITALISESSIEIVHSSPDAYFKDVSPSVVYKSSLIPCWVGCYTSMIALKQKYRELERQLFFTEKIASVAALRGGIDYPLERINDAVRDMLNMQFHDILPGSVIKAGEESGFAYAYHGLRILNEIRADAFFALCRGQRVADKDTYPILVFNPKMFDGEQIVECELSIEGTEAFDKEYSHIVLLDEDGKRVPCQTVKEDSNQNIDRRKRIVFRANLTPMGISRFTAIPEYRPNVKYPQNEDIVFDNGEKRVRISAKTGLIESYIVNETEYLDGSAFAPVSFDDYPDPWGMKRLTVGEKRTQEELKWQMTLGENPTPCSLMKTPNGVFKGMRSLQVIEDGEIYLAAEAFFESGLTRIQILYKLYKQGNAVDVSVRIYPAETDKAYKLCVPMATDCCIGEQIFGEEELFVDGRENIAHNYLALKKGENYLEVVTPTTYGSCYLDGKLYLTLLRTATYCAHPTLPSYNRPLLRQGIYVPKIDIGEREFAFRLMVSEKKDLKRNADIFTEKPYALNVFPTIGEKELPPICLRIDNPTISVCTMKKAELVDGYLIRLHNPTDSCVETSLKIGGTAICLRFGKYEVKTVCYDGAVCVEKEYMDV